MTKLDMYDVESKIESLIAEEKANCKDYCEMNPYPAEVKWREHDRDMIVYALQMALTRIHRIPTRKEA